MIFDPLKLRSATLEDSDFLLELKNDPVMRKFAVVSHSKITKKAHEAWLKLNIGGIFIIMLKGQRMGMFRIAHNEVSINLSPICRGQGIGSRVLKKFCPKGLWAKIVAENIASLNIFTRNGFKFTEFKDGIYYLEN